MSSATRTPSDTRAERPIGRSDGVYFLGRPHWLADALLCDLRAEADAQRDAAEHIRAQHFAEMGPVGQALCESAELLEFVTTHAAYARRSGKANYRYYDIPNSHVRPHVDTDEFWLNVIVMLRHTSRAERRSALLLFPHGPDPIKVILEPGEVILFNAKEVIHARTPIAAGNDERAVNMGIGFTPTAGIDNPGFWHPTEGWAPV